MRQPLRSGPIPGCTRFRQCIRRCPASVAPTRRAARRGVIVLADLSARGRAVLPKSITVNRIMGEGSFGQVFEGSLSTPAGNQRVVLKRVKTRVQGAESMSQMEHLLNVYASRVARGHCADFLGYCEVADSEAGGRLTPGLWLVWKYEGKNTLSYYISRRDTLRALATDMQVSESAVVPTVMKHIFEGLAAFHAAGLVHRDIKPLNIIFAEDSRRFKLIDLGACADLRSGTNYVPEESILDLNYCPPEQFVLPTDSPHIAKQGLLKLAISPMLWAKHKPDRFDTWSAGMVMLQLAIPCLRSDRALRSFNEVYGPRYQYDLAAWRRGVRLNARDAAVLDENEGAGWELLQSLLAPRHIQVEDGGGVSFVNDSPFPRISAYEALKHRFIRQGVEAAVPAPQPAPAASRPTAQAAAAAAGGSGRGGAAAEPPPAAAAARGGRSGSGAAAAAASGSGGGGGAGPGPGSGSDPLSSAMGVWRDVTGRLFDLEAKILRQASATELQTTTVKRLKEQVQSGRADPSVLQKEEKVLGKMQSRLAGLQQDFSSTANQASSLFAFLGFGRKGQQQQQQAEQQAPQPAPADSGLPPGFRGSKDRTKASLDALRAAEAASAAAAASAAPAPATPSSVLSSVWEALSGGLGDLEAKLSNQASATERQSRVVAGLRAKVAAGEAEPELLSRAERVLNRMQRRLMALDRDFRAAQQAEGDAPSAVGADRGGSGGGRARDAAASAAPARSGDSDGEGGSFWSRLLGTPGRSRSGSGSASASMDGDGGAAGVNEAPPPAPAPRAPSPFFRRAASPTPAAVSAPQQPPQPSQDPSRLRVSAEQLQQLPQQPAYKSIFGAFGGGGASGSGGRAATPSRASPAPLAPEPAPSQPPPLGRAVSPRSAGLFGGLFSRPAAPPPPQYEQQPPGPSAASSAPASAASPGAPSSAPGGDALLEGAGRVLRSSLGFTGLAAKIAGDLAAALKADAERYFREMEAAEEAKRQQRSHEQALLALLREVRPPMPSATPYEEAEARLGAEEAWAALAGDEARRRQLYGSWQAEARKAEEEEAVAAEAGFKAALRRCGLTPASSWQELGARLPASDPALAAVQDPARRRALFEEVLAAVRAEAERAAEAQRAELEFTALLAELRDPPISPTSTWPQVRSAVAADPRCQALQERRRRELFEAFTAHLLRQQQQQEAGAEARGAGADSPASPPTGAAPPATAATPIPVTAQPQARPLAPAPTAASAALTATTPPVAAPAPDAFAAPADDVDASAPLTLEDDDLAAALEGMEAALESAIRAVSSAPMPSAALLESAGLGGASSTGGASAAGFTSSSATPGAGRTPPPAAAPALGSLGSSGLGGSVPGSPGGGGAFDGSRLEELKREQARLRAEYEAMAGRLREMEERLRSQARSLPPLAPSTGIGGKEDGAAPPLTPLPGAAEVGAGGGAPADAVASSNGVPASVGR